MSLRQNEFKFISEWWDAILEDKNHGQFSAYARSALRDTRRSIGRNKVMSAASILSIFAALIILGIFVAFTVNLDHITSNVESAMSLKVYVNKDMSQDQINNLQGEIQGINHVKKVSYVSASDALSSFSKSLGSYSGLLNGYNDSNNPMPASFDVEIDNAENIRAVRSDALKLKNDGVTDVKYGEEYVDALVSFSHFSNAFCIALLIILSVVSVFIVYNTIKLTCFARRKEIRVMRYVGATDAYIRAPFVLEGTILGAIGAIIAALVVWGAYTALVNYVNKSVYLPMHSSLVAASHIMPPLTIGFILYGVIIGALGSVISMRKFLEV